MDERIDLEAVQSDDQLLDAIGRGQHHPKDPLERMLIEWRAVVRSGGAPDQIQRGMNRAVRRWRWRRRFLWFARRVTFGRWPW